MSYSRVRENTASLWMTKDNTQPQFPTDGQGGVDTVASASLVSSAGPSNPVIIEAVLCDYVVGSAIFVNIRELAPSTTDILQIKVPPTAAKESQYIKVGGPYGVRVEQPFRVRINASGTTALPAVSGADEIGKVTIFFRYA
jgi:hypothetical protein